MEEFNIELTEFNALDKYFSILPITGYLNIEHPYKILVLDFIREIFTGEFSFFVSNEDYDNIANMLYCLFGTCLIPYPEFVKNLSVIGSNFIDRTYRITEQDDILRKSEDEHLRVEV